MEERIIKTKFYKNIQNQSGFTLMEVMIAIAIFTVFATVFATGLGYNLLDSGKLKEDILLKDFAENKIHDIIIDPPELKDSLTLTKETKDVPENNNYQIIVEYKKLFVPDMRKILGNEGSEEGGAQNQEEDTQEAQLERRMFNVFKENMEKMIWQVEVTSENKLTKERFRLSTWIYNHNADVKVDRF